MSKFKPENSKSGCVFGYYIEDFVTETHFARVVDEIVKKLDTSAIEKKYSYTGQKSYHPKILLKILFYGYALGICSSRKLMTACREVLPFMYLSQTYQPNFRTISDFRKDNISEIEKYFVQVLKYCNEIGMLNAGIISIDGSKFRANASSGRTKDIEGYKKWEQKLKEEIKDYHKRAEKIDDEENNKLKGAATQIDIPKEIKKREDLIKKIAEAQITLAKRKKERENQAEKKKLKINVTDPDAKFQRESKGIIRPNYNGQIATTKEGIIAGADISQEASDKKLLIPMITQVKKNTNQKIDEVKADSGYASYENYENLEKAEIDGYIPDQECRKIEKLQSKGTLGKYHKENFKYDQEKDEYICPEGEKLNFHQKRSDRKNTSRYKCNSCANCKIKNECTTAKNRTITRHNSEYLQEVMRKKLSTPEGKKKYYERMNMAEAPFGHFKKNLGFQQFLLRGLEKVRGEFKLLCTAYNIMKIYRLKLAKVN